MDESLIRRALESISDEPFLRHEDGHAVSARVLLERTDAVGAAIRAHEVQPGAVVAISGLSREDAVAAVLGTILAGHVAWPLSDRDPPAAIARQLTSSGARLLIAETAITVAPNPEADGYWSLPDAATLMATSGTTGRPKLAVHTLENHWVSARSSAEVTRFEEGDTWLMSLGLHHIGGLQIVFRALTARGCVVLPDRGAGIERALCRNQPSHVSVVATQLARLLDDPACVDALRSCRTVLVGGGPIPEGLRKEALSKGVPISVSYGSTETTALATAARDADVVLRPQSAGTALPGREVTVADDGEIVVGGPGVFQGYLVGDTVQDVRRADGAFATGDLGVLDDDGVLSVLGRKDRRFVSGGENIQPEEIEVAIEAFEGVERAAVVPVPHAEYGERPVAFVHVDGGTDLDLARLRADLRRELPGFKVPDAILLLPVEMQSWPKPDYEELARRAAAAHTPT